MKISYSSGTKMKYQIQWTTSEYICQFQWSSHSLHLFLNIPAEPAESICASFKTAFIRGMKYKYIQKKKSTTSVAFT